MDISFISIKKVLYKIKEFLSENSYAVFLIKPQFEAEKEYIEACQNKNQKLGNIKMTALSKESGWGNIFNGYFQESEDE